ncbi:MAG: hypothetical protein IPN42_16275 [Methylococcaceae bacterium]|nr:hypothetical protein [Methylococcaceae bacterium]
MADFTQQEILNALQQFKWDYLPGQKKTRSYAFGYILMLFLLFISYCQESLAEDIQNPVIFELKYLSKNFERYNIKIFQDGKVHYHGNKIINEISTKAFIKPDIIPIDHYAQLTKAQLDELVVEFLSLPFRELYKYEPKLGSEGFAAPISFKLGHANMFVNNLIFHKALLAMLKKYIPKDLISWLCNPSEHDEDFIQNCEKYIFLPDNFKF